MVHNVTVCILHNVFLGLIMYFWVFYSFLLFIVIVAFSGLGFLSLYFAGKLHCFQAQGRGQGWKLCVALVPVTCALALALTRYSDYRHHWQGRGVSHFVVEFRALSVTKLVLKSSQLVSKKKSLF